MTGIKIELQLSDGSFTSGMLRAGQSMEQFDKELRRLDPNFRKVMDTQGSYVKNIKRLDISQRTMLGTLRDLSIVTGGVTMAFRALTGTGTGLVSSIVSINAEMERLKFMMEGMATSSDPIKEAGDNVAYLREMATRVPFSLKEISTTFAKLKATGTDPMAGSMQALTDGIAAFGGTDEQLHRVTLGISQMSGKSVIQMEEMRQQLSEAMPTAMQTMARSMGASVAELTQAISTGRVQAQPALQAFYGELERTYGGTAQRMMQTFSGQITQVVANLQQLSTGPGMKGFVDGPLKNAMQDLNAFLQSGDAKALANQIGEMLSKVTVAATQVVKAMFEWRSEIGQIAILLAKGVGIFAMIKGFGALRNIMNSMRVDGLKLAMAYNEGARSLAAWTTTANAAGSAGRRVGVGLAATATGVRVLSQAAMIGAPYLLALGSAVSLVSGLFGSFKDNVKEAYDELRQFGATSREEAARLSDARAQELRDQIRKTQAIISNLEAQDGDRVIKRGGYREQLAADQQALKEHLAERQSFIDKSGENEAAAAARLLDSKINEDMRAVRLQYRRRTDEDEKWLREQQVNMKKSGRTQTQISEENAKRIKASRLEEAEAEQAIIQRYYDQQKMLSENTFGFEQLAAEDGMVSLGKRLDQVKAKVTSIREETLGIQLGAVIESQEDKLIRGQKMLNSLSDDVAGLKAKIAGAGNEYGELLAKIERGYFGDLVDMGPAALEMIRLMKLMAYEKAQLEKRWKTDDAARKALESLKDNIVDIKAELVGATGATAKMQAQIDRGDFGSIEQGGAAVRKMHEALLLATEQKETLDRLMKGQSKIEADIERNRIDLVERRMALEERRNGRQLSEAERTRSRLMAGYYDGLGPIDNIMNAVSGLVKMINLQGKVSDSVADVMQNQTFGQKTRDQIDMTTSSIERLGLAMMGVSGSMAGINFSTFGKSIPISGNFANMRDLIGAAEGTDKGRGYNETLGYGAFTGGSINLTNKTLDEILQIQKGMLANPNNTFNSSALGRYQIVSTTLRSLMKEMGLTGKELFSPEMQDRMADQLLKRRGNNPASLRNEWEGLRRVDDKTIIDTFQKSMMQGPQQPAPAPDAPVTAGLDPLSVELELNRIIDERKRKSEEYRLILEDQIATTDELVTAEQAQSRKDYLDDLIAKQKSASLSTEELGKNHEKLLELIQAGSLGSSRDVNDKTYANLIAAAKELDRVEKNSTERKQAAKTAETDLKKLRQEQVEIQRRLAEEVARTANPDYVGQSSELRRLNEDLNKYLDNVRVAYGEDTQQYRDALAMKRQALADHRGLEAQAALADAAKAKRDIEESLMTEGQQRKLQLDRRMAEVDRVAGQLRAAGRSEIEISRWVEEQKAAIRKQAARESSPIQQQMAEWADLQGLLAKKSAEWTDSLATGVAGLITGTGDLKSAITGMINDVANMAVRYMISQKKTGMAAGGGGGMDVFGFLGKMLMGGMGVPVAHTGGIIGSSPLSQRSVSPGIFTNAPKFHSGGIVSPGLLPSEQPVITKKGEGVFTQEQMAALAPAGTGGQAISINAPVTVNASGGTPEQNNDLAKQMAREMEQSMRTVVVSEISRQMRPGALLNRG